MSKAKKKPAARVEADEMELPTNTTAAPEYSGRDHSGTRWAYPKDGGPRFAVVVARDGSTKPAKAKE